MTALSHTAISYILAQSMFLRGHPPTPLEQTLIIAAGNILDLDYLIGLKFGLKGEQHHSLPTHTPLGAIIIGSLLVTLFMGKISMLAATLIYISIFLHLILDESGYWLSLLKLQKISPHPQIAWLYPFKKSQIDRNQIHTHKSIIADYFTLARAHMVLELFFLTSAYYVRIRIH